MLTAPCKDCAERHPGCHSECARYKEYSREMAEIRERKILNNEADRVITDRHVAQHWKWWKHRRG